jgi:hypothetical protein
VFLENLQKLILNIVFLGPGNAGIMQPQQGQFAPPGFPGQQFGAPPPGFGMAPPPGGMGMPPPGFNPPPMGRGGPPQGFPPGLAPPPGKDEILCDFCGDFFC